LDKSFSVEQQHLHIKFDELLHETASSSIELNKPIIEYAKTPEWSILSNASIQILNKMD